MGIINFWQNKQDSHAQFEALMRPHLKQLYHLAYRYTGNKDDAEDLVQDLMVKLFLRLEEMKKIEKLFPWLGKILYRQFIDQLRRQQRSPIEFMDEDDSEYEIQASHSVEPETVINAEITRDLINAALQKLKDNHRLLVLLHDVEGYNMQEISDMIDIPVGTVKSRLSRARSKLREVIKKMELNETANV